MCPYLSNYSDVLLRCSWHLFLYWSLHRLHSMQEVRIYVRPSFRIYLISKPSKFLAVCSLCFLDLEPQQAKSLSRIPLFVKWTSR